MDQLLTFYDIFGYVTLLLCLGDKIDSQFAENTTKLLSEKEKIVNDKSLCVSTIHVAFSIVTVCKVAFFPCLYVCLINSACRPLHASTVIKLVIV